MVKNNNILQIALDKEGNKLGKVDESSTPEQIKIIKNTIQGNRIKIILRPTDVLKQEGNEVWLDITKKEFDLTIKKHQAMQKEKTKKAKMAEASSTTKASTVVFTWGKI
ncbi:MAG: hypothetical protein FK731_01915 [Asgard group archaeon]|nr:hypothetical protein [Asgard group archaeon]